MAWICYTCRVTIRGHKSAHCAYCHRTFTDAHSEDMHHAGKYGVTKGPDRYRCLTLEEMLDKGMTTDARGYWMTGITYMGPGSSSDEPYTA